MPHRPNPALRVYAALARSRWPRSYRGRLLLALAGAGALPLAALGALVVAGTDDGRVRGAAVLAVAALGTAAGVALAALLVHHLLAPVRLTATALRHYRTKYTKPRLPTDFPDEAGMLMADVQHAIDRLDEIVVHVATYDRLTGLPNRILFRDQVRHALAQARRDARPLAVCMLDVDGFTNVNLSMGHHVGDSLLTAVAQRLQGVVRETDIVARMDGDEFAILCGGPATAEGVDLLARRIVDAMQRPFVASGKEVTLGISIGVTMFPTDDGDVEQLIQNATSAQCAVQSAGGNGYRFFSSELNARLQHRMSTEADLRRALERGQLALHYQPKVDVATGKVRGFEALLRWHHPERGLVSPVEFIPIAEETGLIVPIGEWVLRRACSQVAEWRDAGIPVVTTSVNLSARQFKHADLATLVRAVLHETRLDPALLELEVTESMLMEDTGRAVGTLQALREHGVSISLDDFGTGYSSLGYLTRFPIDAIKLDKSFVRDVVTNRQNGAITTAIIDLGHSLGLDVVAEGVETREQFEYLAQRACDVVQGFLFGRPVPADEVPALVEKLGAMPPARDGTELPVRRGVRVA
ncbi:EAL domain-containing protein [Roseisolibacter sp. H3M3-2]|uniref:putative bifunctional diguanylate cyclase/phosphodiesterase n=1 Tax=Roseisolibacter sp. H3M3-2 TaxID=3031323 RepID=UPI0023DB63D6|nr:EAL domain-containing protein [Roseisolibacter sp. H3M3-2]MDF1504425.1 EAL domain-containing protein [Roseisolibacter sp. H3M3-2]